MIGDYDDDTHFCLKCHSTILGLDNYVSHRKAGCSKNGSDAPKSPLPSQLLPPDESFSLKAVDFFSSLELQSSSKKSNVPSTSGKQPSGILTRSKTATIQATKENIQQSKSGKNVWIGDQQIKEPVTSDNQCKLIKSVDNLERRKEEDVRFSVYAESDEDSEDYDTDVEETSDEDAPPRNHTGGKWKPSSPINWNRPTHDNSDWNVPPPSFTGGKWKPAQSKRNISPPPSHTKGKWKPTFEMSSAKEIYESPPPSFTGSKWTPAKARQEVSVLSAHSTKGKWKPRSEEALEYQRPEASKEKHIINLTSENKESRSKGRSEDAKKDILPPSYTKGKWKPRENKRGAPKITDDSPLRKSSGMVQYWCRPCNRRLASKVVYERHLKSELHFKRILRDKEFDDVAFSLPRRVKRKVPNLIFNEPAVQNQILKIKKRTRQKLYIYCEVCKTKVNKNFIGKHLISHYHCRNSDLNTTEASRMILDYIHNIIFQSPFQCNVCKFYCNTHEDFLKHWISRDHVETQQNKRGYFLCPFCKFEADTTEIMYNHLISDEHKDVLLAINRSVPIIIKKILPIYCNICDERFTLNIQFLKHCKKEEHDLSKLNLSKINFLCDKCDMTFSSAVSLSRHKQNKHKENVYVCSMCDLNFSSSLEAKIHRNTKEHRYRQAKKQNAESEQKCDFCDGKFQNLETLKEHLKEIHSEHQPRCPRCNMEFTVPQELTIHLRSKSCTPKEDPGSKHKCSKCAYSTNTYSQFLYHEALHSEPYIPPPSSEDEAQTKKTVPQYECPLCKKLFTKYILLGHLRFHAMERPFVCSICNTGFVRKSNWLYHLKRHATKEEKQKNAIKRREMCGERPFLCSTCGSSFQKKPILQQHMLRHTGKIWKCLKQDCIYAGRTPAELNNHINNVHDDSLRFSCVKCDYKGKTKHQLIRHASIHQSDKKLKCSECNFTCRLSHQLKRHSRVHTGAKPYNCPHCNYRCNNLENLRKHVLSTNKHPGKCIYECKFCSRNFQTNFAKDFKVHLVQQHSDSFQNFSDASTYITGIYQAQEDATVIPNNVEFDFDMEKKMEMPVAEVIIIEERAHNQNLTTRSDPIVTSSSDQLPSTSQEVLVEDTNADEIFTAYASEKDEIIFIENAPDSWNLVASYDEDSGTLVSFEHGDESLFNESFH